MITQLADKRKCPSSSQLCSTLCTAAAAFLNREYMDELWINDASLAYCTKTTGYRTDFRLGPGGFEWAGYDKDKWANVFAEQE